jgi:hypothetical protein
MIARFACLALIVLTAACDSSTDSFMFGPPSRDEVARATSPGGDVDAVLFESNGGATTSFGYQVSLVPKGEPAEKAAEAAALYAAVRSKSAYGVNLHWASPSLLWIEYESSRGAKVKQPTVFVAGREVTVELYGGVTDPSAPSGGMLYNLQGRPNDH